EGEGGDSPSELRSTLGLTMTAAPRLAIQETLDATVDQANGGRVFVRDLQEGDRVAAVFVVRERSRLSRRNGEDFLKLLVADRTGAVEAVIWEDVDACFDVCAPGSIVRIEGQFSVH